MRIMREMTSLPRDAFRLLLACQPESQIGEKARAQGFSVEFVKMRGNIDPLAVLALIRIYRRHGVDIVHSHSNADSWNASIAAKLTPRRPLVVRTRHLSAAFNNRLIYNFMADRVVTTGEYTRQYMIREKGIDPQRVLAIPSGINLQRFNPERVQENLKAELGIPPDAPVFGSASIFRRKKGYHHLLEATKEILRAFPGAKLLLVGDGPQKESLTAMIGELAIQPSVILPGFREDMPQVLNTMDIFVFPTLEEAFPNAVMEAMAMGRAVVATRVGGVPDIVTDGQNGLLVEPGDISGMVSKVSILLRDQAMRCAMGERGRKFVEANCRQEIMVKKLEQLYQGLMGKEKR
jgi:glycosyltransferase involved in cell wall biosynthesis